MDTFIQGNIKQQLLPFVLLPDALINSSSGGGGPLLFTFRKSKRTSSGGVGIVNFCPSTMKDYFEKDISYKLIYQYNKDNKPGKSPASITFDSLLENIPAILIREYIPDTAFAQSITFFTDLIKSVMSMFGDKGIASDVKKISEADNALKSTEQNDGSIFKKLWNVAWFVINYITKLKFTDAATNKYTKDYDTKAVKISNADLLSKILKFPHMIYYKLQGCTTTNIYELPCIKTDKQLYSSDGEKGWNAGAEDSGFRFLKKQLAGLPFVGPVLNKMFGNIGISWMPWWNAADGNETIEPPVEITFDLFNDSNEAALKNFIFINTLIPNNKWILYGLFLHSSHIYDVKLEGYNRLFACSGQFSVTYDGVLRDPPPNWSKSDGPLAAHVNSNIDKAGLFKKIYNSKLIKIPDIYKVKLTFNSLLPSNFNNYLYTYVANNDIAHDETGSSYQKGQLGEALGNAFTGLLTGAKAAFTADQKEVPEGMKLE